MNTKVFARPPGIWRILMGTALLAFCLVPAGAHPQPPAYDRAATADSPRDQTLAAGEYFLNTDPGEGNGTALSANWGYAFVTVQIPLNLNGGDVVHVRFKSSNGTWCPARSIRCTWPLPNRGATLAAAECFVNTDPGVGKGLPVSFGPNGRLYFPALGLSRGDAVYVRVRDSFGRWSAAASRMYQYMDLQAAEYQLVFKDGTSSGWTPMTLDPVTAQPAYSQAWSAPVEGVAQADVDRVLIRFQGTDYIWGGRYTPLVDPSDLTAAAISASQIDLAWKDNSTGELGFEIERKTGSGGQWGPVATVGEDVEAFSDTGLAATTTYYYRVRAYTSPGCTVFSNEAGTTTFSLNGNFSVGGYLGVGMSAPARAIHIQGGNAVFRMDRNKDTAAFMIVRTDLANKVLKTYVVGVNASGANQGSFVVNDLGATTSGSGNNRLTLDNDGKATFAKEAHASGFFTPSARWLKSEIRPLDGALDTILNLQAVHFHWRDTGAPSFGFIVEDAAGFVPEVVSWRAAVADSTPGKMVWPETMTGQAAPPAVVSVTTGGSGISGLDYGRLTALLVEGLREQQQIINRLEQKRDRLQSMLDELRGLKTGLHDAPRQPQDSPGR